MSRKTNALEESSKRNVEKEQNTCVFTKPILYYVYATITLILLNINNALLASGFTQNVPPGKTVFGAQMVSNPKNPFEPFIKSGSGDFMTHSSTYSGHTTIRAGRFFAMGQHGNSTPNQTTFIHNNATLAGTGPIRTRIMMHTPGSIVSPSTATALSSSGSIASPSAASGGIVSPSGGIVSPSAGGVNFTTIDNTAAPVGTTMVINNDYAPMGVKTWFYLTPTACDRIQINGAFDATNGTFYVTPKPGYYYSPTTPLTYTIINWQSLNGAVPIINVANPDGTPNTKITVTGINANASGLSINLTGTTQPLSVSTNAEGEKTADINTAFSSTTSSNVTVPADTTLTNTGGESQTINVAVEFQGAATISTTNNSQTTFSQPIITSAPITLTGNGKTVFSANNSTTLSGNINLSSSTAEITDGANLGSGEIILKNTVSAPPKIVMGSVALPNAISATTAATFETTAGKTAELSGSVIGSAPLTFNGNSTGITKLTGDSPSYTGTLDVASGKVSINGNFGNAPVTIRNGATLGGAGTVKDVLSSSAYIRAGRSIAPIHMNTLNSSNDTYTVEVDSAGNTNTIIVSGNTTLTNPTFNLFKDAGAATGVSNTYKQGVIDYVALQSTGTLAITGSVTIKWLNPNGASTVTAGVLTKATGGVLTNYLVLKETLTTDVTITTNQADITGGQSIVIAAPLSTVNIAPTDVVSPNSGLRDTTAAPIAAQPELTDLVFQSNSNEITSTATADAFRFKGFSSGMTPSVSGKKNTIETLLTALSKNGPVSYERNETRLWISPFVNRSRTNRTSSDLGNQGWSGGSLVGLEQRNKKNTWSTGLLTGLMGSHSHTLGSPDTFSKTNGLLFGAFNTYRYTKKWGHELLISRTNTFINAQRYGLDNINKQTPYYAVSNYKSITDVGNAQVNYLFNIIKKKITCRLNTGITYTNTQTGKITERNAGTNGLTTNASKNSSMELYSGIGLRRIWETDKLTIRTTGVYEYGYQLSSTGSTTTTTQSVAPTTFTTPISPRQNKHYLQLNNSYLDRDTGLKFIVSYSGMLYKNVRNHTGMAKVEYRF